LDALELTMLAHEPQIRLMARISRYDAQCVMALAGQCRAERDLRDRLFGQRCAICRRRRRRYTAAASSSRHKYGSALPVLSGRQRPNAGADPATPRGVPAAVVRA